MVTTTYTKPGLVIVGAGAAGLSAAVAAAEKGQQQITVLEARAVQGGNAVFVGGMFGAQSRLQRQRGIDADCDDLFKKAMDYAHWKTDPRLIRALIEKSGTTIQWLEDHGLEIDQIFPFHPNQVPVVFHLHKPPNKLGANYVKTFTEKCEALGVRINLRTRAKTLLKDDGGRIAGVVAETPDGDVRLPANGVILATGGFLGNPELIRSYLPTYYPEELHPVGIPHHGDGHKMAVDAGAAEDGMLVLEMNGPTFPPSAYLSIVVHDPNTLWVNSKGQRFTDESLPHFPETANSIYRQPGKHSYTLFDQTIKQRMLTTELNPLDALLVKKENWAETVESELSKYASKGRAKTSDSLDDIAGFIGADADVLRNEVDIYNSACDHGHDPLFAKDRRYLQPLRIPPFWAVEAGIKIMTTHGGPKINYRMEVMNTNDDPIPGLYAAGVETGCTDSNSYCSQLTGHSFGFSVVSGRIAGENAVTYLSNE
jgi:fumarate reductase flavoprotein subunit